MQFGLTDEEEIRDTARRIAADRPAPVGKGTGRGEGAELLANLKELARNGFMTLNVESRYGGTEAGTVAFALAIEELGYACASTAVATSVTNMVGEVIQAVGSAEHKEIHLPRLADGTYPAGAFCSRRAAPGPPPRGRPEPGATATFVLDGSKIYITSAEFAGIIVWAVTDPNAPKGRGISLFLVERRGTRVWWSARREEDGQHGSPTNAVHFDGRRARERPSGPRERRIPGRGRQLAGGRIGVAASSLGIARAAMDAATTTPRAASIRRPDRRFPGYPVDDRRPGGRSRGRSSAHPQGRLSEGPGESFAKAASMAKLFASEAAHRATDTAIQLHGGAGYGMISRRTLRARSRGSRGSTRARRRSSGSSSPARR